MEQVFGVVNQLLARDSATRQRALHVRRYKVIPLVGATGLIEFVADTRTLGDVVIPLHSQCAPSCRLTRRH
jgi:ataxia telangiectasia mutated family protein